MSSAGTGAIFSELLQLISNCLQFTRDSREFMDHTDALYRIGVNAQILAANAVEGGEVLGVLVKEIGQLTGSLSETMSEFAGSGAVLARLTTRTAAMGNQLRFQDSAVQRVQMPPNKQLLDATRAAMQGRIDSILRDVRDRFQRHRWVVVELQRSSVFIPALVSLLKINVASYDQSMTQFQQTAADLSDFRVFLGILSARMMERIDDSLMVIEKLLEQRGVAGEN